MEYNAIKNLSSHDKENIMYNMMRDILKIF